MKTTLFTLIALFGFTAFAVAQEEQDKTQRQPPVVTQTQVEKDAKMAEQERKKHEEAKKLEANKAVTEENKKADDKKAVTATNNSSSAKKTSRPGKQ